MTDYPIIIGNDALKALYQSFEESFYSNILILVDTNTHAHCYPNLVSLLPPHVLYEISPGESYKTLDTCSEIWEALTEHRFDRKGLVINLGGGVIGDMGGFVAGTYKRGIDFIQLPTTLLSQVDASVGGKLGIDFHSYKNHIGLFANPKGVYIYPEFLDTLPQNELISGFAEVIKHHLIADRESWEDLKRVSHIYDLDFTRLIQHSVDVKAKIVADDPKEQGARKALNFGHTIGHAIESLFLERDDLPCLLHGEAIAIGMITESYLSQLRGLLTENELDEICSYIQSYYPKVDIPEEDYEEIFQKMKQDKKNQKGKVLCTLLDGIGAFLVNQEIQEKEVRSAFEFYLRMDRRS